MRIVKLLGLFCLLIAAAENVFAQATTGTILGSVVDPARSAVADAAITLKDRNTGTTRSGVSASSGTFEFPNLLPGNYSVEIEAKGFKTLQLDNIALSAAEKRNLGSLVVQIGAVSEKVSVTAEVTPVETASASVGQTIDSSAIRNITLKGRDPFQLIGLLPGVVDTNTNRDMEGWNSSSGIVINGLAAAAQSHLLDGMANDDDARTNTYVNPNPDAIAELSDAA